MNYREWSENHQKAFDEWANKYGFFAFNKEQFENGLKKLNCTVKDIYRGPAGMFYLKTGSAELKALTNKRHDEFEKLKSNAKFMESAFYCEMCNHEYSYTMELDETLYALGLSLEEIDASEILRNALLKAHKKCLKNCD